jgi:hypothetical protein
MPDKPKPVVGRSGKLLLALTSTVILGSESCRTHDHIFLSHDSWNRATALNSKSLWIYRVCIHRGTGIAQSVK